MVAPVATNCHDACEAEGLTCKNSDLRSRNFQVDNEKELKQFLATLGENINTDKCSNKFKDNYDTPKIDGKDCFISKRNFDCTKVPEGENDQRLCYCSSQYLTNDVGSDLVGYVKSADFDHYRYAKYVSKSSGGTCTCPSGEIYTVGANVNHPATAGEECENGLACEGGLSGTCSKGISSGGYKATCTGAHSYRYVGCFELDKVAREFTYKPDLGPVSADKCFAACKDYRFFSLEQDGICYCGKYRKKRAHYSRLPDTECNNRGAEDTKSVFRNRQHRCPASDTNCANIAGIRECHHGFDHAADPTQPCTTTLDCDQLEITVSPEHVTKALEREFCKDMKYTGRTCGPDKKLVVWTALCDRKRTMSLEDDEELHRVFGECGVAPKLFLNLPMHCTYKDTPVEIDSTDLVMDPPKSTDTIKNAFDNNVDTYVDSTDADASFTFELLEPALITGITFVPRKSFESRMKGATFVGITDDSMKVTLATISKVPSAGESTVLVGSEALEKQLSSPIVKVQYQAMGGHSNVAEIKLLTEGGFEPEQCGRPDDWCTNADTQKFIADGDCDGDGIVDPMCEGTGSRHGESGCVSSADDCRDTYSTVKPSGFSTKCGKVLDGTLRSLEDAELLCLDTPGCFSVTCPSGTTTGCTINGDGPVAGGRDCHIINSNTFVEGEEATNLCPAGYEKIKTAFQCNYAATKRYLKPLKGLEGDTYSNADAPGGCFEYSEDGHAYAGFNSHVGKGSAGKTPICAPKHCRDPVTFYTKEEYNMDKAGLPFVSGEHKNKKLTRRISYLDGDKAFYLEVPLGCNAVLYQSKDFSSDDSQSHTFLPGIYTEEDIREAFTSKGEPVDLTGASLKVTDDSGIEVIGECRVEGSCISSGAADAEGNYGNNRECIISGLNGKHIRFTKLDTEARRDILTINGRPYSGNMIPGDILVEGDIKWKTDGKTTGAGFQFCAFQYTTKISNREQTGWRPSVKVQLFSDERCKNKISASVKDCSGFNPGFGSCDHALLPDNTKTWRPQCHSCGPDEAFITLRTSEPVRCVRATSLGTGCGGSQCWNGGLNVEFEGLRFGQKFSNVLIHPGYVVNKIGLFNCESGETPDAETCKGAATVALRRLGVAPTTVVKQVADTGCTATSYPGGCSVKIDETDNTAEITFNSEDPECADADTNEEDDEDATGAVAVPDSTSQLVCAETDYRLKHRGKCGGGFVSSRHAPSWDLCQLECENNVKCGYFSYAHPAGPVLRQGGHNCYLFKTSAGCEEISSSKRRLTEILTGFKSYGQPDWSVSGHGCVAENNCVKSVQVSDSAATNFKFLHSGQCASGHMDTITYDGDCPSTGMVEDGTFEDVTLPECLAECSGICRGVSYDSENSKCHLRSGTCTETVDDNNYVFYETTANAATFVSMGGDCPGNDIGNGPDASGGYDNLTLQECQDLCVGTKCVGVSYRSEGTPRCAPKYATCGTDVVQNDHIFYEKATGGLNRQSVDQCAKLCKDTSNCAYFSFNLDDSKSTNCALFTKDGGCPGTTSTSWASYQMEDVNMICRGGTAEGGRSIISEVYADLVDKSLEGCKMYCRTKQCNAVEFKSGTSCTLLELDLTAVTGWTDDDFTTCYPPTASDQWKYEPRSACTISGLDGRNIEFSSFATEKYYDVLKINGEEYSGNLGAFTVDGAINGDIDWYADDQENMAGWEFCVLPKSDKRGLNRFKFADQRVDFELTNGLIKSQKRLSSIVEHKLREPVAENRDRLVSYSGWFLAPETDTYEFKVKGLTATTGAHILIGKDFRYSLKEDTVITKTYELKKGQQTYVEVLIGTYLESPRDTPPTTVKFKWMQAASHTVEFGSGRCADGAGTPLSYKAIKDVTDKEKCAVEAAKFTAVKAFTITSDECQLHFNAQSADSVNGTAEGVDFESSFLSAANYPVQSVAVTGDSSAATCYTITSGDGKFSSDLSKNFIPTDADAVVINCNDVHILSEESGDLTFPPGSCGNACIIEDANADLIAAGATVRSGLCDSDEYEIERAGVEIAGVLVTFMIKPGEGLKTHNNNINDAIAECIARDCEHIISCGVRCVNCAPTKAPTENPTASPTTKPTSSPTKAPTLQPTAAPTNAPSRSPTTKIPTASPTNRPTGKPTSSPTTTPTDSPTTAEPTRYPTGSPTTKVPTASPTTSPTKSPSISPTVSPTKFPTEYPTEHPTESPTNAPTDTDAPTNAPTDTDSPTMAPTESPTPSPSFSPSESPSKAPVIKTDIPTIKPTLSPTVSPSASPTNNTMMLMFDLPDESGGETAGAVNTFGEACKFYDKDEVAPQPAMAADFLKTTVDDHVEAWLQYMCFTIHNAPVNEVISSIWLWKQVCISLNNEAIMVMASAQYKAVIVTYCPADEGGGLNDWALATFRPAVQNNNENFNTEPEEECELNPAPLESVHLGSVTLLMTDASFETNAHISMIIHDHTPDGQRTFPEQHDTTSYVSWHAASEEAVSSKLTGQKAMAIGYGEQLSDFSYAITVENVNVTRIRAKWKSILDRGVLFNAITFNCGRVVLVLLDVGLTCHSNEEDLTFLSEWSIMAYAGKMAQKPEHSTSDMAKVKVEQVTAMQIPKKRIKEVVIKEPFPVEIVVATILTSLVLIATIAWMCYQRQIIKAKQKVAANLSKMAKASVISHKGHDEGPGEGAAALFKELDKDGDSHIEKSEFVTMLAGFDVTEKEAKMAFDGIADGDDVISYCEFISFIDKQESSGWMVKSDKVDGKTRCLHKLLCIPHPRIEAEDMEKAAAAGMPRKGAKVPRKGAKVQPVGPTKRKLKLHKKKSELGDRREKVNLQIHHQKKGQKTENFHFDGGAEGLPASDNSLTEAANDVADTQRNDETETVFLPS